MAERGRDEREGRERSHRSLTKRLAREASALVPEEPEPAGTATATAAVSADLLPEVDG